MLVLKLCQEISQLWGLLQTDTDGAWGYGGGGVGGVGTSHSQFTELSF